jgi:hypothetical protein
MASVRGYVTREVAMFDVEDLLREHHRDVDRLVKAGCVRNELLAVLRLAFLSDDSWKTLLGAQDARQLKNWIAQIRHGADLLERINDSLLIHLLSIETAEPKFATIHESPTLPQRLRVYADNLDWARQFYGPKRAVHRNAWKAYLIALVLERTGKPHDAEVCALVGAVLERAWRAEGASDAEAHKRWRSSHGPLIGQMRKTLPGIGTAGNSLLTKPL